MKVTVKDLKSEIKMLENEIRSWREKFYAEERKRLVLEAWIRGKFTWWIELLKSGSTPCMKYLIKDTAVILGMKYFD